MIFRPLAAAAAALFAFSTAASAEIYCDTIQGREWQDASLFDLWPCLEQGEKLGRDIDGRGGEQNLTLLEDALQGGANGSIIDAILQAGADPNLWNDELNYYNTPLMREKAYHDNYPDRMSAEDRDFRVRELLEAGADPNTRDKDGWTAYSYSLAERGKTAATLDLVEMYSEHEADFTIPVPEAAGDFGPNNLFFMLRGGASLPAIVAVQEQSGERLTDLSGDGSTALHRLLVDGPNGLILARWLISEGVDPRAQNDYGKYAWETWAGSNPEVAAYVMNEAGVAFDGVEGVATTSDITGLCWSEYHSMSRKMGDDAPEGKDLCGCVTEHTPGIWERIQTHPRFDRVFPASRPREDVLEALVDRAMMGCMTLYSSVP